MRPKQVRAADWLAGVAAIAIGLFAIFVSAEYRLGTAREMGPGYFPAILGVLTICFGIAIVVFDGRRGGGASQKPAIRALIAIMAAIFSFAIVVELFGLAPAAFCAAFIAAFAERDTNIRKSFILSAGLAAAAVIIFKLGLSVQVEVFKW